MSAPPGPLSAPLSGDARLDSWKEIANYLGREVRTVQGWEKTEGLPVHRHQHARQGSIYAFKPELDAWRLKRADPPPAPPAPGRSRRGPAFALTAVVAVAGLTAYIWSVRSSMTSPP